MVHDYIEYTFKSHPRILKNVITATTTRMIQLLMHYKPQIAQQIFTHLRKRPVNTHRDRFAAGIDMELFEQYYV